MLKGSTWSAPLTAALVALLTTSAWAGEPAEGEPAEAPPTAEAIFTEAGLTELDGCLDLSTPARLRARRTRWRRAIDQLATHHPEQLHAWIIGAEAPPELATREAKLQRDCMIGAMLEDAANPESPLVIELDDGPANKKAMKRWAKKFEQSASARRQAARRIDRSHYRSAAGQAFIWYRKFTFTHPRSFNLISPAAAEKCGLTAGHTWRPSRKTHQRCWNEYLSAPERQREILTASSAPGISRHHWGTEFDLFGLNPRHFHDGARLHDEWTWMTQHGLQHGFFQPFLGNDALGEFTYIEERWHWSYYPISQALTRYAREHDEAVDASLNAQWDRFEKRWGKRRDFFSFVREHWRDYAFNIAQVELAAIPWMSPSSLFFLV